MLSSAGLRALGIGDRAPDPLGGWYERDTAGRLTGRLDEYAEWGALRRLYSKGSEKKLVSDLRAYADSALRLGVTTVQDMAGLVDPALTVRAFRDADLPIRVRLIRWPIPDASGRNEAEWDTLASRVGPRTVISGRKWVLDATPIEQNALMRRPYPGRADWYGRIPPGARVGSVSSMRMASSVRASPRRCGLVSSFPSRACRARRSRAGTLPAFRSHTARTCFAIRSIT